MKFHRSVLFAGLLAFGATACGDDVQIVEPTPPPPPPLVVSLSPSNASINAGEVADFAVTVSGGVAGAAASWTCASSATGVATVAVTATGCRATGVANGNASITATVTKGGESTSAAAQVSVRALEAAEVSIFAVNQMGTTANINAIAGQLDVIVNVDRKDENPTGVELVVTDVLTGADIVVAGQTFGPAAVQEVDGPDGVVQQVTLSFNTALYSITGTTATVRHKNGQHGLRARLTGVGPGGTQTRASQVVTVRFTNADALHITQDFVTAAGTTLNDARALDATGLVWIGGPNFTSLDITLIPVIYTRVGTDGQPLTVSSINSGAICGQAATTDTTAPFTFVRTCANFEGVVAAPGFTGVGSDGNLITFAAGFANANRDPAQGLSPVIFPIRIDTRAPTGAVLVMAAQAGLLNRENWGNASYSLTSGYTAPADAGVGLPSGASPAATRSEAQFRVRTGTTVVAGHEFSDDARTLAGLANSVNNSTYNAQVQTCDRLANCGTTSMTVNPAFTGVNAVAAASHNAGTFGVDKDAPIMSRGNVGGTGITTAQRTINFAAGQTYEPQATDVLSGFAAGVTPGPAVPLTDAALAHNMIRVVATPGSATLNRTVLIGGAAAVAGPFATSNAGAFVTTTAAGAASPTNTLAYTQTPTSISTGPAGFAFDNATATAGYYIYQARARDKAGNLSDILSYQVYFSNGSVPALTGLVAPGTFTGGAMATFPGTAQDAVEVHEGSFDLRYPAAGSLLATRLIYPRPMPTVSTLFDDVITIPATVNFTAANFIRALQGVSAHTTFPLAPANGDHAPVAGLSVPDQVTGRVYNGFNASQAAAARQNHQGTIGLAPGAGPEATTGTSAHFSVPILGTQVQTGVDYTTAAAATRVSQWAIESYSTGAASGGLVTATIRVRVSGASGTFVNPFAGGIMIVERTPQGNIFADPVNVTLTPLFTAPFPTLDNGAQRDFVWTFTMARATGTTANLHAIGLTSGHDGLVTREATISFAASQAAGTAPVYN